MEETPGHSWSKHSWKRTRFATRNPAPEPFGSLFGIDLLDFVPQLAALRFHMQDDEGHPLPIGTLGFVESAFGIQTVFPLGLVSAVYEDDPLYGEGTATVVGSSHGGTFLESLPDEQSIVMFEASPEEGGYLSAVAMSGPDGSDYDNTARLDIKAGDDGASFRIEAESGSSPSWPGENSVAMVANADADEVQLHLWVESYDDSYAALTAATDRWEDGYAAIGVIAEGKEENLVTEVGMQTYSDQWVEDLYLGLHSERGNTYFEVHHYGRSNIESHHKGLLPVTNTGEGLPLLGEFQVLTQAQYDALGSALDEQTMYFIVED